MRWHERQFTVGMPHLVPGQLSEVELLKLLGDAQWHSISQILESPSTRIVNDSGERLYASFISLDLGFGGTSPRDLGEGTTLSVRHAARFYARRFAEGFFCFGDAAVPAEVTGDITTKAQLEATGRPWLYCTNAFVTREESNSRLRTFAPAGATYGEEHTTDAVPDGIREHEETERTGALTLPGMESATRVEVNDATPITYAIVPESDLNGAGLLYFARYLAIANYGERLFLRQRSRVEVPAPLIRALATQRRRICYYANANDTDAVAMRTSALVSRPAPSTVATQTSPLQFFFTTELRRQSDGVVMAVAAAHKVLTLPAREKSAILNAHRIAAQMGL